MIDVLFLKVSIINLFSFALPSPQPTIFKLPVNIEQTVPWSVIMGTDVQCVTADAKKV